MKKAKAVRDAQEGLESELNGDQDRDSGVEESKKKEPVEGS